MAAEHGHSGTVVPTVIGVVLDRDCRGTLGATIGGVSENPINAGRESTSLIRILLCFALSPRTEVRGYGPPPRCGGIAADGCGSTGSAELRPPAIRVHRV